jgi:hypothetical protein
LWKYYGLVIEVRAPLIKPLIKHSLYSYITVTQEYLQYTAQRSDLARRTPEDGSLNWSMMGRKGGGSKVGSLFRKRDKNVPFGDNLGTSPKFGNYTHHNMKMESNDNLTASNKWNIYPLNVTLV